MKRTFIERLKELDWMDEATKKKGDTKVCSRDKLPVRTFSINVALGQQTSNVHMLLESLRLSTISFKRFNVKKVVALN